MARYGTDGTRTASTTLSVLELVADGTTARRMSIYDWIMGSGATPADNAFEWQLRRVTAAGTPAGGSTVNIEPLDSADVAALADATEGRTTDRTIDADSLLSIPLNQRASFRWVAAPGGEIITPATVSLGIVVMTPTSAAVAVSTSLHFSE